MHGQVTSGSSTNFISSSGIRPLIQDRTSLLLTDCNEIFLSTRHTPWGHTKTKDLPQDCGRTVLDCCKTRADCQDSVRLPGSACWMIIASPSAQQSSRKGKLCKLNICKSLLSCLSCFALKTRKLFFWPSDGLDQYKGVLCSAEQAKSIYTNDTEMTPARYLDASHIIIMHRDNIKSVTITDSFVQSWRWRETFHTELKYVQHQLGRHSV